jgi:hypothetical protein
MKREERKGFEMNHKVDNEPLSASMTTIPDFN